MKTYTPEEKDAIIENLREAINEVIQILKPCSDSTAQVDTDRSIELLTHVLGLEGAEHLKALRQHEALVMGLLAYRSNALESLLPDICPSCLRPHRQHAERCRYGLALTLIPEGMPPIEASAVYRTGVISEEIVRWAAALDVLAGSVEGVKTLTSAMRNTASKI